MYIHICISHNLREFLNYHTKIINTKDCFSGAGFLTTSILVSIGTEHCSLENKMMIKIRLS